MKITLCKTKNLFVHIDEHVVHIRAIYPNVLGLLTEVAICLNMKVAGGEIYLYVSPIYLLQPTKYSQTFSFILWLLEKICFGAYFSS